MTEASDLRGKDKSVGVSFLLFLWNLTSFIRQVEHEEARQGVEYASSSIHNKKSCL